MLRGERRGHHRAGETPHTHFDAAIMEFTLQNNTITIISCWLLSPRVVFHLLRETWVQHVSQRLSVPTTPAAAVGCGSVQGSSDTCGLPPGFWTLGSIRSGSGSDLEKAVLEQHRCGRPSPCPSLLLPTLQFCPSGWSLLSPPSIVLGPKVTSWSLNVKEHKVKGNNDGESAPPNPKPRSSTKIRRFAPLGLLECSCPRWRSSQSLVRVKVQHQCNINLS